MLLVPLSSARPKTSALVCGMGVVGGVSTGARSTPALSAGFGDGTSMLGDGSLGMGASSFRGAVTETVGILLEGS